MLILVPEFIGAIFGIVAYFDPLGSFRVINYIVARTTFSARVSISGLSDMAMIVYSMDMINAFRCSRTNDKATPTLIAHEWGLPVIVTVGIVVPIADVTLNILSMTGNLGSSTIVPNIPVIFLALVYLTGTVILVYLSLKVGEEVDATVKKAEADAETRGATATDGQVAAMVVKIKLLRKYMLASAAARIATIFGLLLVASGWMFWSPFMYAFTIVTFLSVAGITSSTFQVLIAVEITPAKKSKKPSTVGVAPTPVVSKPAVSLTSTAAEASGTSGGRKGGRIVPAGALEEKKDDGVRRDREAT